MPNLTDQEFIAIYCKVDAETDMAENSDAVDAAVGLIIGSTVEEVASRYDSCFSLKELVQCPN